MSDLENLKGRVEDLTSRISEMEKSSDASVESLKDEISGERDWRKIGLYAAGTIAVAGVVGGIAYAVRKKSAAEVPEVVLK
jgi:hypothetical protein